ncbi:riboflavin synthase [Polynucleobacter sp. MWH-Spelu-300-X4]|uniref:riboflavin synthase n=1 Tax=Polynucleobacter sp. MWH-Spelu-300-X4 TaxID=2689109 RepID=UPI001BFD05DE|nr:riboflavin synthase [Polynucleobacter sp. MWH-Spelu-300-X4]QWD80089.1 riboflavin synthase [Polynucleobacter sp. MWH-Spelu-300-X4]
MFTGIIQAVGKIEKVTPLGDGYRLTINAGGLDMGDVQLGDSIALQGACMTVVEMNATHFSIDISAESINKTTGLNAPGFVNLEKALRVNDRLGGHLVSGHVDGIGAVVTFDQVKDAEGSWHLVIKAPISLAKYLAYKGSIVVNGTSLTVNQIEDVTDGCLMHINLIPHTLENTTLQYLKAGSPVNLEVDLIARYVERMLSTK